jgi:hypothetical protein
MFTAFTEEIDDVDAAVSGVLGQLALDGKLKRHSLGLLHCYHDFVDSGVVKELCARLPFPVVGYTTISVSTHGGIGGMALTLSVLTSDEVCFHTGLSSPLTAGVGVPLEELYARLLAPLSEAPKMLLLYAPFLPNIGGDEYANKLNELAGGIPSFGALSISDEPDYSRSDTLFNGEAYEDALVLVGLTGDVRPEFLSVSVMEENMVKARAVATGSEKHILVSVDGMSTEDYIASIGLAEKGGLASLISTPFIAELENGVKLTRTCLWGDGQGGAVLCGHIPVGAKLGFAIIGPGDITRSSGEIIREALELAEGRCMLLYSCAARNWSLGINSMAEHETASGIIGDRVPYEFAYCGGEIFPNKLADGRMESHLQNCTLIVCIL